MNNLNLLADSLIKMPSFPEIDHTLLFIQTKKYIPFSSLASIDNNIHHLHQDFHNDHDSQLSLLIDQEIKNPETLSSISSTKKKRAGCTCKKTQCLKMYCECFSAGKMCTSDCICYGCSNDHQHLDCIEKAREVVKIKSLGAGKKHHQGCTCKKSQCQKKYCECFNAGIACGDDCRCEDCANNIPHSHSDESLESQYKAGQKIENQVIGDYYLFSKKH